MTPKVADHTAIDVDVSAVEKLIQDNDPVKELVLKDALGTYHLGSIDDISKKLGLDLTKYSGAIRNVLTALKSIGLVKERSGIYIHHKPIADYLLENSDAIRKVYNTGNEELRKQLSN